MDELLFQINNYGSLFDEVKLSSVIATIRRIEEVEENISWFTAVSSKYDYKKFRDHFQFEDCSLDNSIKIRFPYTHADGMDYTFIEFKNKKDYALARKYINSNNSFKYIEEELEPIKRLNKTKLEKEKLHLENMRRNNMGYTKFNKDTNDYMDVNLVLDEINSKYKAK